MKNDILVKNVSDITEVLTSHGIGSKQILLSNAECDTNLMQVAIGTLKAGDKIEKHIHDSMEEYYYFFSGSVMFHIEKEFFAFDKECFIKVPCKASHWIEVKENCRFIYWGVAT